MKEIPSWSELKQKLYTPTENESDDEIDERVTDNYNKLFLEG